MSEEDQKREELINKVKGFFKSDSKEENSQDLDQKREELLTTLKEKRNNKTNLILNSQITRGLKNIKKSNNIIFAYEPVWSIGTGIIPKTKNLEKQVNAIKKILIKFWKLKNPKVIYGGSVNPKNITELKKISLINGFLIGGASQNSKNFIDIIKKTIN